MLAQAFSEFNRSADRLSTSYKQLAQKDMEVSAYQLLLGALECISSGILVVDREYRIIVFNKMAQDLTGLSMDEVIDKYYWEVFNGNHFPPKASDRCRKKLLSGVEVDMYTAPIADDNGSVIGTVGIIAGKEEQGKETSSEVRRDSQNTEPFATGNTLRLRTSATDLTPGQTPSRPRYK